MKKRKFTKSSMTIWTPNYIKTQVIMMFGIVTKTQVRKWLYM